MPVATMSYSASTSASSSQYSTSLPPPAREFLVNVDMWTSFANIKHGKNKVYPLRCFSEKNAMLIETQTKSSRSRPSSSLFTGSASASTSQDDLALAHSLSAATDTYSHYSAATSNTAFTNSAMRYVQSECHATGRMNAHS